MNIVTEFFVKLSNWLNPYLFECCMAQIATFLVIYSGEIDGYFRKLLKPNPFLVRVSGFVLLNAFGYGIVTIGGAKPLKEIYLQMGPAIRVPIIFAMFIVLGVVAERKKHI